MKRLCIILVIIFLLLVPSICMALYGWLEVKSTLTTTDATESTLWIKWLEDETVYLIETQVIGQKSDGSQRAMYWRRVLIYRDAGGNTFIQGAVQGNTIIPDVESDASWDCDIDVVGENVRLRVTGAAATTVIWNSITRYHSIEGTT